jgi:hypothetical protein
MATTIYYLCSASLLRMPPTSITMLSLLQCYLRPQVQSYGAPYQ